MEKNEIDFMTDLNSEGLNNAFRLLELAGSGRDVTLREDQLPPAWIRDAVRKCRKQGARFRLLDSGRIGSLNLEWILVEGADLYTGDTAGRDSGELVFLADACRKGGAVSAYLLQGEIQEENEKGPSMEGLLNIAAAGTYLHISNRKIDRDAAALSSLAHACHKSGSRLIYYHHGGPEDFLMEVASAGAWIHLTDECSDQAVLCELAITTRKTGANIILHSEGESPFSALWDALRYGACVLFQSVRYDYKSPFRPIEDEGRNRLPDFRAFYLQPHFLP